MDDGGVKALEVEALTELNVPLIVQIVLLKRERRLGKEENAGEMRRREEKGGEGRRREEKEGEGGEGRRGRGRGGGRGVVMTSSSWITVPRGETICFSCAREERGEVDEREK